MVQIRALKSAGYDGTGIVLGIVDTGIDLTHPELSGATLRAWQDFVNNKAEPYDDNGHGTMVASVIIAHKDLRGGAAHATLIVAKVISSDGKGTDENVAKGIDYCRASGAVIISISLGGLNLPFIGSRSENAVSAAVSAGVFVVAAAGNSGPNNLDVSSPSSVPLAISVGAVNKDRYVADFSSRGSWAANRFRSDPDKKPETVAPGVDILVAYPGGKYAYVSGTSIATPFVTAALALVLQMHPNLQNNATAVSMLKTALMNTALHCDEQSEPHDGAYGYGLLQAYALANAL